VRWGLLPPALAGLLAPSAASACTWCVSSAFGDRTFNWPYLGLIIAPFFVGSVVAGVLAYHYTGMVPWRRRRVTAATPPPVPEEGAAAIESAPAPAAQSHRQDKEMP
jgi:hypothetical protein